MKKLILSGLSFFILWVCSGQQVNNYKPLDVHNPIEFGGKYIVYQGDTIVLGSKAFFIDGQLSNEEAAKYPYVYNSVNKAAEDLTDGTEEVPMVLYIAPYVYWIDDPDDPEIRVPKKNEYAPYGLIIKCEWLRFQGLTEDPQNVVLACNRGQTIGSKGNFTLFKISGQGPSSENVTFGNYCNVDLVYPLKPELNRGKRASAIVQAQLIVCNGDKIVARNTKFISRLNLLPFVGGKRTLFDHCHFESTDDALCTTGLYLDCTFDFYASKPFVATTGTGAILLNCDIRSFTHGAQYFTKLDGQLAIVDTRITTKTATYFGWKDVPPIETRNYQYNVSLNGKELLIGAKNHESTIDMTDKPVLNAYRLEYNGKVVYNTYNLLRGNDNWDPMGIKDVILAAEKESGKNYSMLPVQLLIIPAGAVAEKEREKTVITAIGSRLQLAPMRVTLETKKDSLTLVARTNRFGNYELNGKTINWSVDPEYKSFVELKVHDNGSTCDVIPTNLTDEPADVVVKATTTSGLEAASLVTVTPSKLAPPKFISTPVITKNDGKLRVNYKLDMKYEDQSLVTWFRCTDAMGGNPIEVAVSRFDKPMYEYELSGGDIGYYLMASVAPKNIRCDAGKAISTVTKQPVNAKDINSKPNIIQTDFSNFPTKDQPKVIPGFWTLDSFDPKFPGRNRPVNKEKDAWYYGEGKDGAKGRVGLLQAQYARMFYTPVKGEYGDMKLSMEVAPYKTAGQGFSIANLYMDVLIKFDAKTLTGYGLRFIRTTKFGDAVDCVFVKYENGEISEISDPVTTSCYRTPCFIVVEVNGNKLSAHAETTVKVSVRPHVENEVTMETEIEPGNYGGFGIQYAGGAPTMINNLMLFWK